MREIEQYITHYFGIGHADLSGVADLFVRNALPRHAHLLRQGQYGAGMSFVRTGFLRISALDATGEKEVTQWISSPGQFVTDLSSLVFRNPARRDIQALTDCELYTISHDDYHRLGDLVPEWPELEKLFLAKCFITLENRVFSHLSMSAEARYQQLFEQTPELFNQVPLHYLASMLGMTPETFSWIRKRRAS